MKHYVIIAAILMDSLGMFAQNHPDTCKAVPVNALTDSIWELNEVQVTARRQNKAITGTMSGKLVLQMESLKSLPQFLGTADPIRTMQLMPGVQTAGELNSGIYIRGGEPSHNQVLINGAPVYNAMHLMGFFSVFNGSHFSNSTLLKSYIGPEYGGRLAGVLSMTARDTVSHHFEAEGSIGMISSQATLAIPLTSKSSLYLSGRATYLNLILAAVQRDDAGMRLRYDFQDYNLTYVYQPFASCKILVNGYFGGDKLSAKENLYQADGGIKWNNVASSVQWLQDFRDRSRLEQTLFFSYYKNNIGLLQNKIEINFPSDIRDIGYKGSYRFNFLKGYWSVGADYTCHLTNPQYPDIRNMFGVNSTSPVQLYKTHETGVFIDCHAAPTDWLAVNLGLRYSSLFHTGAYREEKYDKLGSKTEATVYKKRELVKRYGGLEPRVSLEFMPGVNQKVILSYGLFRQYMNQVAVSGIGFPTDFWIPASKNVLPQSAHAFSAGYFCSVLQDAYEFSVEGYYKRLSNQLEFDGELFDMVNQLYLVEDRLLVGKGETYGAEIMLKKNTGALTGWISYSLGWSRRRFPDINDGQAFPAKHDRRHDLSVVANYRLNRKWDFSAVFVYATGNAFTMPTAFYLVGENAVNEYGPHNGARMPAYHRMDVSANYWFKKTPKRESGLNLSIYNVYARKNPIFLGVKIETDKEHKKMQITKKGKSLYSLLPSVSYTFKF